MSNDENDGNEFEIQVRRIRCHLWPNAEGGTVALVEGNEVDGVFAEFYRLRIRTCSPFASVAPVSTNPREL